MPIYEYRCLKCGHQFEKLQSITDHAVKKCEKCGARVTRLFHPVAIHFKGSGFYSTDYAKKKSGSSGSSGAESRSEEKPRKKKEKQKKPVAGKSKE